MSVPSLATILPISVGVIGVLVFRRQIGRAISEAKTIKFSGVTIEREKPSTGRGKNLKEQTVKGVSFVQIGMGREEAFLDMRRRAQKRIIIMGIGMTELTHHALQSLESQAKQVSIDLLMIDPEYLLNNKELTSALARHIRKPNILELTAESYQKLKHLCNTWNQNSDNIYKLRLRLYSTIPSMTMVTIDPSMQAAETLFEVFLPWSGQRARFKIKRKKESELFDTLFEAFEELWNNSRDGL